MPPGLLTAAAGGAQVARLRLFAVPDDIVITCGLTMEGLNLALRAVARSGE